MPNTSQKSIVNLETDIDQERYAELKKAIPNGVIYFFNLKNWNSPWNLEIFGSKKNLEKALGGYSDTSFVDEYSIEDDLSEDYVLVYYNSEKVGIIAIDDDYDYLMELLCDIINVKGVSTEFTHNPEIKPFNLFKIS